MILGGKNMGQLKNEMTTAIVHPFQDTKQVCCPSVSSPFCLIIIIIIIILTWATSEHYQIIKNILIV